MMITLGHRHHHRFLRKLWYFGLILSPAVPCVKWKAGPDRSPTSGLEISVLTKTAGRDILPPQPYDTATSWTSLLCVHASS